ncbi:hypothetical protein ANTRET_LOCUS2075 [Anthophora retusa]
MYICFRGNLQKLVQYDHPGFSNASIFNSIEQFVRTVSEMEETILIPSRLLDLTIGDSDDKLNLEGKRGSIIKATLTNTDLYHLYNIISQLKVELLWSREYMNNCQELQESPTSTDRFRYTRCSSTTSIYSVQSIYTSSDSESDIVVENDFRLENEETATAAARSFKRHLHGLHRDIQKMTLAAEYLTLRYQTDINGHV